MYFIHNSSVICIINLPSSTVRRVLQTLEIAQVPANTQAQRAHGPPLRACLPAVRAPLRQAEQSAHALAHCARPGRAAGAHCAHRAVQVRILMLL